MKNFKMNGGWWLFLNSAWYLVAGTVMVFGYHMGQGEDLFIVYLQIAWLFIISLPLWVNPVARFCNMKLSGNDNETS